MRRLPTRVASQGVSLIEALIALAVMAIGMLGLVGMQATLRSSSDTAKQRAEAVRYAQQGIEEWRAFSALGTTASRLAYQQIVDEGAVAIPGVNATYQRTRTVTNLDSRTGLGVADATPRAKTLSVTVSWLDRSNVTQSVTLNTALGGVVPDLRATLAVPADGDPVRQPFARSRGIPTRAVTLADDPTRSAFNPPGASPGVQWVFNNVTGLINICGLTNVASPVSAANLSCSGNYAMLLSGAVRYALGVALTADNARNPPSLRPMALNGMALYVDQTAPYTNTAPGVACFTDLSPSPASYTPYYCAIPVEAPNINPGTAWSGRLYADPATIALAPDLATLDPTTYKLCRYFANATYVGVRGARPNQNLLVISGSTNCPDPGAITWPHQPAT